MAYSHDYFNSHSNQNRVMGTKATNSLGVVHQANPAPAILARDEAAYSIAMQRNADNRRIKSKVTLAATPWG